jgi:hypothetical protein
MALPWRPTTFLFEKDEVCWSGGMNVPLISSDIKEALLSQSGGFDQSVSRPGWRSWASIYVTAATLE